MGIRSFAANYFTWGVQKVWGCVKRFFTALYAKWSFERYIIFEISRSEISKMMCLSKQYFAACGDKRLFTVHNAKLYLDWAIFFLILRSKIRKKMAQSKECFAGYFGEISPSQVTVAISGFSIRQVKFMSNTYVGNMVALTLCFSFNWLNTISVLSVSISVANHGARFPALNSGRIHLPQTYPLSRISIESIPKFGIGGRIPHI